MKKYLAIVGAVAMACAAQTGMAQFFTNDLTDAAGVALDFTENISSVSNAAWSYTNDYALAEDGTANTVLQGGAVQDYVTVDDDTARSYVATVYSNYLDASWTAHVAFEAPASVQSFFFMGMGSGVPLESYYHEPRGGEAIYLRFRNAHNSFDLEVMNQGGTKIYDSGGDVINAPGADVYMTYNHDTGSIRFEVDDWNAGRFSGIDFDTPPISIAGHFTTNMVHIFFGGNPIITYRDFDVAAVVVQDPPSVPDPFYTTLDNNPMEIELDWVVVGADAFFLKRSTESGSNYVEIASGPGSQLSYVDTNVVANQIYYYMVEVTNQNGSAVSGEITGRGVPYQIIGLDSAYVGTQPWWDKGNLFDGSIDEFFDTNNPNGGWIGLDYGAGNEQRILGYEFVLRNWGSWRSRTYATNSTFEAANSADFSDAVVLYTHSSDPTALTNWPVTNSFTVANPNAFRYVRFKAGPQRPLFFLAELAIFTADGLAFNYVAKEGNDVILGWDAKDYKLYDVNESTDLDAPTWTAVPGLSNLVGSAGATMVTTTVTSADEVFYQLEEYDVPAITAYETDFEVGPDGWTWTNAGVNTETDWELGEPTSGPGTSASGGTNSWATNLAGNHGYDADVRLHSPEIDLTGASAATLRFSQFIDIETDAAATDTAYVNVLDTNLTVLANLSQADGTSTDWEDVELFMPPAAVGQPVILEFQFISDNFANQDGWYVDDVSVTVP